MYRIDPDQEPAKFRAQGLLADRGAYTDTNRCGRKCGCLIGRMAVERVGFLEVEGMRQSYDDIIDFAELLDLPTDYALGLMDGWEGGQVWTKRLPLDSPLRRSPDYQSGLIDGEAAWSACVAAEVCESAWLPDID